MFSHLAHVMTLANSIIGVGILAMPFCFQKCGIILATLLLILNNWITRICCHYLIKCSLLTRRKSFEFLGFHSFGSSGKLLVELGIIGYLLGTCITYFVVVGDLGPQIVVKMLSLEGSHIHLRTWIMIAVTLICILPLGMLKNVDSLSTVCTASIGFYICLVIKIVLESEEHIIANDWTENVKYWEPAGVLQCLPIFSMALACQMQLFEVFGSINNQSLEKLNDIVKNATWICTSVYVAVGFFGYVAFCTQNFSGNILLNLSPSFGSDVIKIGFVLSIAFSFPLVIFPCRASIYSLLYRRGHTDVTGYIPESRFKAITTFIVALALCIALLIPSVELVIGLVGSTIGVAICIMFPAACYRQIVKKPTMERTLAQLIFISGFCLMILGTYVNLNAIDEQRSGAHIGLPNVDENLLRPTTMPEEVKFALKQFEMKNVNQSEDVIKKVESLGPPKLLQQNLEKPQDIQNKLKSLSSPPPLPVDEKHEEDNGAVKIKMEKINDKFIEKPEEVNAVKLKAAPKVDVHLVENKTKAQDTADIAAAKKISEAPAQGINNDAIKKDEEVAAEETKHEEGIAKATENEELKKTQNELKKTKELLERTVDELKEELAKQNKETQDLVVEKLGAVAEKVEQIQKKVEQQKPRQNKKIKIEKQNVLKKDSLQPKNKGSLVSIMNANANNEVVKQLKNKEKDSEPLSYKTGEKIESLRNATNLKQRLRLPLPLLINSTQTRTNDIPIEGSNKNEKVLKETNVAVENLIINSDRQSNAVQEQKNENDSKLRPEPVAGVVEKQTETVLNEAKKIVAEKENVEAIRRDILQLNAKQLEEASSNAQLLQQEKHDRIKRSSDNAVDNSMTEIKQNYLADNKIETIILLGVSGAIESKMKSIGRTLKALDEQEKK